MTVQLLDLDVFRWEDLVRVGVERTVGASEGAWTLHSPIDPGVTFLEALAWQIEQRLFRLNEVPDSLVRLSLSLLGLQAPRAAVAATSLLAATSAQPLVVPRGAGVHIVVAGRTLRCEVQQATAIAGGDIELGLQVGGIDKTTDLHDSGQVGLIDENGRLDMAVTMRGLRHHAAGGWLSLYLDASVDGPTAHALEESRPSGLSWVAFRPPPRRSQPGSALTPIPTAATPSSPSARWRAALAVHETGGVRLRPTLGPPVAVTWSLYGPAERPLGPVEVLDGTDGFRRPGVVHWRADNDNLPAFVELRATSADRWPGPPVRLHRLNINALVVRHHRRIHLDTQTIGDGWIAAPGLELDLPTPSEEDRPLATATTGALLRLRERDGVTRVWRPVVDLAEAGPGDRVFEIDRELSVLRFGDGIHGRVPRPAVDGEANGDLRYTLGGGATPDVAADVVWQLDGASGVALASVLPLTGGLEAETLDAAAARARVESARGPRIVNAQDAVQAALSFAPARLARAYALPGHDPAARGWWVPDAITVFCVPRVPIASNAALLVRPRLDDPVRRALNRTLQQRRLLGTRLFVAGPEFVDLNVVVRVRGDNAATNAAGGPVEIAVRRLLHPLAGGVDDAGWPFGEAVSPAAVLAAAHGAAGRYVDVAEVLVERWKPPPSANQDIGGPTTDEQTVTVGAEPSVCRPLAIEPFELPWLRTVRVERVGPQS